MGRPAPLESPHRARETLAHRLSRRVDRLRQLKTRFGMRPDRVFLVWTKWSGVERGEGRESILARVEIVPTPEVSAATAITRRPWAQGILPEGSVLVSEISSGAFTKDELQGLRIPWLLAEPGDWQQQSTPVKMERSEPVSDPKVDFFWEIVEDGRGDDPAERSRFRVFGEPARVAELFQWKVVLERASQDTDRLGRSREQDDDEFEVQP